jgi:glycosyltransferase involved in cell wall biosynthesis
MNSITTVTAITPVRNGALLVGRTVSSIATQRAVTSGRVRLQYVLCDGASSDDTVGEATRAAGDVELEIISEPDQGMYDALAKGFRRAEGEVVFYLNAGDALVPNALDVVLDLMEQRGAKWLKGYDAYFSPEGFIVGVRLPFRFRRRLVQAGAYGRILPMLQQESTFWRRELLATVDLSVLATYRLAGDNYLWNRFASVEEITIARVMLGGFCFHGDHLSDSLTEYKAEMTRHSARITPAMFVLALVDRFLWHAPDRIKRAANRRRLALYDRANDSWI